MIDINELQTCVINAAQKSNSSILNPDKERVFAFLSSISVASAAKDLRTIKNLLQYFIIRRQYANAALLQEVAMQVVSPYQFYIETTQDQIQITLSPTESKLWGLDTDIIVIGKETMYTENMQGFLQYFEKRSLQPAVSLENGSSNKKLVSTKDTNQHESSSSGAQVTPMPSANILLENTLKQQHIDLEAVTAALKLNPNLSATDGPYAKGILTLIDKFHIKNVQVIMLLVSHHKANSENDKQIYGELLYNTIADFDKCFGNPAKESCLNLIKLLIEQGAAGDYINKFSYSILHMAVHLQTVTNELIKTVLTAAPPLDWQDNRGLTALAIVEAFHKHYVPVNGSFSKPIRPADLQYRDPNKRYYTNHYAQDVTESPWAKEIEKIIPTLQEATKSYTKKIPEVKEQPQETVIPTKVINTSKAPIDNGAAIEKTGKNEPAGFSHELAQLFEQFKHRDKTRFMQDANIGFDFFQTINIDEVSPELYAELGHWMVHFYSPDKKHEDKIKYISNLEYLIGMNANYKEKNPGYKAEMYDDVLYCAAVIADSSELITQLFKKDLLINVFPFKNIISIMQLAAANRHWNSVSALLIGMAKQGWYFQHNLMISAEFDIYMEDIAQLATQDNRPDIVKMLQSLQPKKMRNAVEATTPQANLKQEDASSYKKKQFLEKLNAYLVEDDYTALSTAIAEGQVQAVEQYISSNKVPSQILAQNMHDARRHLEVKIALAMKGKAVDIQDAFDTLKVLLKQDGIAEADKSFCASIICELLLKENLFAKAGEIYLIANPIRNPQSFSQALKKYDSDDSSSRILYENAIQEFITHQAVNDSEKYIDILAEEFLASAKDDRDSAPLLWRALINSGNTPSAVEVLEKVLDELVSARALYEDMPYFTDLLAHDFKMAVELIVRVARLVVHNATSNDMKIKNIKHFISFVCKTEAGKEAYVNALSHCLAIDDKVLFKELINWSEPYPEDDNIEVIFPIAIKHNITNVVDELFTINDKEIDKLPAAGIERGFYFSYWSKDWRYLERAFAALENIDEDVIATLKKGIFQVLQNDSNDALNEHDKNEINRIKKLYGFDFPTMSSREYIFCQPRREWPRAHIKWEDLYRTPAFIRTLTQLNLIPDLIVESQFDYIENVEAFIRAGADIGKDKDNSDSYQSLLHYLVKTHEMATGEDKFRLKSCILACARHSNAEHLTTFNAILSAPLVYASSDLIKEILAVMLDDERKKVNDFYTKLIFKLVSAANPLMRSHQAHLLTARKLLTAFGAPYYADPETKESILHLLIRKYQEINMYSLENHGEVNESIKPILAECMETFLQHNVLDEVYQANEHPLKDVMDMRLLNIFLNNQQPNVTNKNSYEIWKRHLYNLVVQGEFIMARILLKAGVPPTYIDNDGNTLLHKALENDKVSFVDIQAILSYYPNIYHRNAQGIAPYEMRPVQKPKGIFAFFGNISKGLGSINELLDNAQQYAFKNISYGGCDGLSLQEGNALHGAVLANNPDLIAELVARKVDTQAKNEQGNSPLRLAVKKGYWECVVALIPKQLATEEAKYKYGEVLQWVVSAKQQDLAKTLINLGTSTNWRPSDEDIPYTPLLHIAVTSQNEDMIEYLLNETQVDLFEENHNGETAYEYAKSLNIDSDTWPALVDKLHPANALVQAIQEQRWGRVKQLLPLKFKLEEDKEIYAEALYRLVAAGQTASVQHLLNLQVSTTWKPAVDALPLLHIAVSNLHADVVKVLLQSNRVDLTVTDEEDLTAYGLLLSLQAKCQNSSVGLAELENIEQLLAPYFPLEVYSIKEFADDEEAMPLANIQHEADEPEEIYSIAEFADDEKAMPPANIQHEADEPEDDRKFNKGKTLLSDAEINASLIGSSSTHFVAREEVSGAGSRKVQNVRSADKDGLLSNLPNAML